MKPWTEMLSHSVVSFIWSILEKTVFTPKQLPAAGSPLLSSSGLEQFNKLITSSRWQAGSSGIGLVC